jgi:hypothetical protein
MSNDVQSGSNKSATKFSLVQQQKNVEDAEQAMFSLRSNGLTKRSLRSGKDGEAKERRY